MKACIANVYLALTGIWASGQWKYGGSALSVMLLQWKCTFQALWSDLTDFNM